MNTKYIWLFVLLIGLSSCNEDDIILPEAVVLPELTSGEADFSNYVALGASFTAGFTDGALFIASQENSFPNILSQQFANAGGGDDFTQPWMSDNIGGFLFGGNPAPDGSFGPRLFFNGAEPETLSVMSTTEATTVLSGPFKNLGVPGAKSFHVSFPGYGTLNPYFGRMASSPGASMLDDAVAQNPTFFTLSEIGGNDVLSYATAGGYDSANNTNAVYQLGNLNPATYGQNDITDPSVFAQAFSGLVDALTANGAKGLVTNVPYITDLPHFTTVPYNAVPLDQATADQLNAAFEAYNGGLDSVLSLDVVSGFDQAEVDRRKVNFVAGQNAVLILDENLSDLTGLDPALTNMRQATEEDLLVLTSASFIGTEAVPGNSQFINGVSVPLADKWVLTPEEQTFITDATNAYNLTIKNIADANANIGLVDFNAILTEASTTGLDFDGFTMNTDLVFGGLISLDGIHLTARGYALMANKFLETIDTSFGSNFEDAGMLVDIGNSPTNYSPTLQ